jgi:hypothetical protein
VKKSIVNCRGDAKSSTARKRPGRCRTAAAFSAALMAAQSSGQADFVMDGEAGFVVANIRYALSHDASETGACPDGMTEGYADKGDVFVGETKIRRAEGETEDKYVQRLFGVAFGAEPVDNLCMNPELGSPNPRFRTVSGEGVPVYGIDMDGEDSRAADGAAPGSCPHDDFTGMNGERGIDNQLYRVVGCSKSFQSTGLSNTFETEMLTGSWGLLITLGGVDDIVNDDEVEVGIYANADPIQLSPNREPLPWSTYAMHPEARYQARTRGRIRDGVLTSEPVDVRFQWVVNSIRVDRPLDGARLRMTLSEEGVLEGYLAGYINVEDLYNFKYGFRTGTDGTGQLAPLRLRAGSSIGKAFVLEHTCEGAYYALYEHADADPDPETGRCQAISTQYEIRAIPAFVVAEQTASSNAALDAAGFKRAGDYGDDPETGEQ